jgi:hypothetical protein
MSEDSLLERVTPAAEERHLSQNTLTAYRRNWLNAIAWAAVEGLALETLPEDRAGTRGRSASHNLQVKAALALLYDVLAAILHGDIRIVFAHRRGGCHRAHPAPPWASGKRGASAFRHRPARQNDPRSVARPLPAPTTHRTPPHETSGSARVRLSHPFVQRPPPSGPCLTSGPTFVTLRQWKRTLSAVVHFDFKLPLDQIADGKLSVWVEPLNKEFIEDRFPNKLMGNPPRWMCASF